MRTRASFAEQCMPAPLRDMRFGLHHAFGNRYVPRCRDTSENGIVQGGEPAQLISVFQDVFG